jgi:hypothetical protein
LVVVVLKAPGGGGAIGIGAVVVVVSDVDTCAVATPVINPSAAAPANRSLVMSCSPRNCLPGHLPRRRRR